MSEFDKEAEREKLREKFARDEEKRKNTRRMSELLLKGATMTNQHCNRCGDPIFRHDGEEFCPTCGGEAAEQDASVPERDTEIETPEMELDSAQEAAGQVQQGQHAQPTHRPQPDQQQSTSTQATPQPSGQSGQTGPSAQSGQTGPSAQSGQTGPSAQSGQTGQTNQSNSTASTPQSAPAGTARAELQRALSTAATNAAAAEDPHTAKSWLEAAREAAEALSALDR